MAFDPDRLSLLVQPIGEDGIRFFNYETDDTESAVTGSGYFRHSLRHGLRPFDLVFVSPFDGTEEPFLLTVETVDAVGHATASAGARDEVSRLLLASRLSEIRVPASVDAVTTVGNEEAGDDGEPVTLYRDPSATVGYVADAAANKFAYNSRTVRLSKMLWGFDQFDVTGVANTAAINAVFTYLEDKGGGCLEIDWDDDVIISAPIGFPSSAAPLTKTIHIENKSGGIIKAVAGMSNSLFSAVGGTTTPGPGRLITHGVRLDNSLASYGVGVSSGSGFSFSYLDYVEMNSPEVIGGHDEVVAAIPTSGGDSGISTVACRAVIVNEAQISGQPDAAFYPNWDNSATVDGYMEINGGLFTNNKLVLTVKRNIRHTVFRGGLCVGNTAGLCVFPLTETDVPRILDVEGVFFKNTLANALLVRGPTKVSMRGCTVEDVGYLHDGTGNVGGSAYGITFEGVSDAIVRDNTFRMVDWASVAETAIKSSDYTIGGTTYQGGYNNYSGNKVSDWFRYTAGTATNPNFHTNETFKSVSSPFGSGIHASTVIEFSDVASPGIRQRRFAGTTYRDTLGARFAPVTVDLTSLGTLAAGAVTATQTLTVTGLAATDTAIISMISASISTTPGLAVSYRTIADGVQYRFKNNNASSFDFTSQSIRFNF